MCASVIKYKFYIALVDVSVSCSLEESSYDAVLSFDVLSVVLYVYVVCFGMFGWFGYFVGYSE